MWLSAPRRFPRACRTPRCATAVAALRTKVNHIVGGFDDVEVMLDNKHGVPRVHQTLQYLKQLTNIIEVEAGSGLIENIEGFACLATLKLACQLHTLSLTTRKRSGGLAQANIAQAHIVPECRACAPTQGSSRRNREPQSTVMSKTSYTFLPRYVTSSVSRLYLLPWHTSQST